MDTLKQARMLLASRIEVIIKELGWKKKDLAQRLGKHPSEISKWLSGKHNFTTDTLAEIEQVTGKSLFQIPENPKDYPKISEVESLTVKESSPQYYAADTPKISTVLKYSLRNLHPEMLRDLQEKYPNAEIRIELESDRLHEGITEARFWELIGLLDWREEGNDNAVIEPVVDALASGPSRNIFEFDDILSRKLFLLDGLVYARHIGKSSWKPGKYFSVDVFLYARCCAVANGVEFFNELIKDPSKMPKDRDFGALLRIAEEAYMRKTGRDYDYVPAYPIETYSNQEAWEIEA